MVNILTESQEPEYGAQVNQERNEQMQQAAMSVAASQYPPIFAEGDEDVAQYGQQAAMQQVPMTHTISNPYMMLPASLNFPMLRQKTPVEQKYDVGLLFDVLGSRDPVMRSIANELMGR